MISVGAWANTTITSTPLTCLYISDAQRQHILHGKMQHLLNTNKTTDLLGFQQFIIAW